ncbi:MAG: hypothetical protein LW823_09485 [Rickettsiales bacterium]|nr:hypothetical protein [Rickettsiales bacterium]
MIIQDILTWKNPYTGAGLLEHLDQELERLEDKIKSSPKFEKKYHMRSDEFPATILDKKEACLDLIKRWQNTRDIDHIELSDEDKTIVSDLVQFVMAPFIRFGSAAALSVANFGNIAGSWSEAYETDWASLSRRAEHLSNEHRHLGQLLIELCDAANYPIPPHVRQTCRLPHNDQRGLL